jgi:hypothetical protein
MKKIMILLAIVALVNSIEYVPSYLSTVCPESTMNAAGKKIAEC